MKQQTIKWEMTMEIVVGVFMFVALLGLFVFTIVLSQQNFFTRKFDLRVHFTEVMGLRDGDNVVVRGMPIGKVKTLSLKPDGVDVLAKLDQPIEGNLRQDYRVTIITTSILGGRYMEIFEGSSNAPPLGKNVILQGERPFDLMTEAAGVVHDVKRSLNEGGILTNLERAVADIHGVTEKLNTGQGTLGKLINDNTMYKDLQDITVGIKTATKQLNEITDVLNRGEGTLGKLLKDDTVYNNLKQISSNVTVVSQRLADGKGTLGKLMSEDDTFYKDLSESASALRNIAARIERGEGTLGKLAKDEALYNEARGAIHDMRAAIDDFRETSPVVSFTSILFSAL